jgi:EAL domain-containing protein (putative c-di-GMP-specific phosphodiesterase class I)
MGVHIAIDDFGTAYSSLSYLSRLPVDGIKIDRSFVHAMDSSDRDEFIVATIIRLAQRLGVEVVAEGVERQEQYAMLGTMGCDLVQGYYVSRPVPPDDFVEWLRTRRLT